MSERLAPEIQPWQTGYQGVHQPLSERAAEARSTSKHTHMTAAELQAAIDAGSEPMPIANSLLCSDGYWTRRD